MLRRSLALTTIVSMLAGCGGRQWPAHAISATDPAIAQTVSVDILPLDLAVWTAPGVQSSGEAIRAQLETGILDATLESLGKHAYGVGAMIDWQGRSGGVDIMAREDLLATVGALAHYGDQLPAPQADLPQTTLPAKLGETTGADATLYLGGWALATPPHENTAEKVAGEIAVALAVVAVVAIVAILLDSKSSKSGSSKHDKRGGAAIHEDREEAIIGARDHRSSAPARDHRSSAPDLHVSSPTADVRPRSHTSLDLSWGADLVQAAAWHPQPRPDAESGLYLEMTLVDNKTGHVLWHAHQWFPADPEKPADTRRAVRTLLASLPMR